MVTHDGIHLPHMSGQFPAHPHISFPGIETVDTANVVQSSAGHIVAAGSVGAGHDPGGAEGDGVHLVGAVAVPHNQLAVLAGRHQVPRVRGPVHGVDLGQVTPQRLPRPHLYPPDHLNLLRGRIKACVALLLSVILKH